MIIEKQNFFKLVEIKVLAKSSNLEGGGLSYKEANIQKLVSHIEKNKLIYAE